jgi:Amt family ammonium transporter
MTHDSSVDVLWIIVSSALVFLMRVGFAMLESGMTRSKNSINVSTKVLVDLGVSLLAYWVVGFGLMFGLSQSGLFGTSYFFMDFQGMWPALFFLFHAMFASTAATIVSGAVAERIKFSSYLILTLLFSAFVYPVLGHWVWGGAMEGGKTGWLVQLGFLDFAGGAVVHATGGWISLAALLVLGPRIGRYNADGTVNRITGAGLQTSIFGTLILWFGWFGFNGGSTLALNADVPGIILKTSLAGAAGMLVTLLIGWRLRGFPDVSLAINGALAGLVGVTAGVPYFNESTAILVGALAGPIMLAVEALLDKLQIDDAVGAIPVHLGTGAWGVIALALFGDAALWHTGLGRGEQLLVQLLGLAACGAWAFGVSFVFLWLLNRLIPIRVTALEEAQGLNVVEHRASTEIYDLYRTLEEQARSGDLTLRAPVEPFTEVGQIANQYNRVMDNLQENLVAKSEYVNILDNVNEGLFLLDGHGRIGPFYSGALEKILERPSLAGLEFTQVLEPLVSPSVLAPWSDYFEVLFNPEIDEQAVSRLNPLRQVELWTGGDRGLPATRHAQFSFRRIEEGGRVVRVMVILRDTTQEVRLQKEIDTHGRDRDQEMQLFYKLLHLDPASLKEFLQGFRSKIGQINQMMETGQNAPREVLKHSFRLLHSIKGEAALLELDFLADSAHALEDRIQELQAKSSLENSDFLGFAMRFGEFQETGRRMEGLVDRLASFQSAFLTDNRKATLDPYRGALAVRLEGLVERTAADTARQVDLDLTKFEMEPLEAHAGRWRDILVQLTRNAVVHGIEPPADRRSAGKSPRGTVQLITERRGKQVTVIVRDDGRGIDPADLARRAILAGVSEAKVKTWSKTDYVRFLFTDGVSTADTATKAAGRGVGLSLVGALVKEAGGRLGVRFETGRFAEFQVTLPDPRNAG